MDAINLLIVFALVAWGLQIGLGFFQVLLGRGASFGQDGRGLFLGFGHGLNYVWIAIVKPDKDVLDRSLRWRTRLMAQQIGWAVDLDAGIPVDF